MPIHRDVPPCPFCGDPLYIFEEPPCGQHPEGVWYLVTHYCFVDIEFIQKGGSIETVKTALSMRYKNGKD